MSQIARQIGNWATVKQLELDAIVVALAPISLPSPDDRESRQGLPSALTPPLNRCPLLALSRHDSGFR
jgi:hypothetical protein